MQPETKPLHWTDYRWAEPGKVLRIAGARTFHWPELAGHMQIHRMESEAARLWPVEVVDRAVLAARYPRIGEARR